MSEQTQHKLKFKIGQKIRTTRITGGMLDGEIERFGINPDLIWVKLFFEKGVIGTGIRFVSDIEAI